MIVFNKITFKNFLGTGNIPTEVVLDQHKTTIFIGDSGSGKSTLLDAISFALFNKPFRYINKTNLVNSVNQKFCEAEIDFTIGTKKYKVRRGVKPIVFEIFVDGVLFNQDSSAWDYQDYLEKNILKMGHRSFVQIVMLGASNFTPFMMLKTPDRRQVIEDLLDIQIFSQMNVLLKQKIHNNKSQLELLNTELTITQEKYKIQRNYIKENTKNIEEKIEQNNKIINKQKELLSEYDTEIKNSTLSFLDEKNVIENKIQELQKEHQKYTNQYFMFEQNINRLKELLSFYKDNDNCPTCNQDIEATFKSSVLINSENELKETNDALTNINQDLLKVSNEKKTFKEQLSHILEQQNKIFDLKALKLSCEKYIQKLEEDNLKLKNPSKNFEEEENKIVLTENQIKDINNRKQKIIEENHLYDSVHVVLKDDGVKASILKQYLPIINICVNKYLQDMSFFVSFEMNENFEETIKARGRSPFIYGNLSDGEKQRLDLALLFTWREIAALKNSVHTNLLILDEIADSYLDLDSTENILQLLTSASFEKLNIIMISHKNHITDRFDKVIQFKKEKGFSKIVG